jgi:hypothetical protein
MFRGFVYAAAMARGRQSLPDVVAPTCGTRGMGRPGPFNLLRSFDVRFTPKADIAERDWELRFVP